MAAFPHHLCTTRLAAAETPSPVVLRSEVERGIARHRRIAADALVNLAISVVFETASNAQAFASWFYGDALAGAEWFDFTHPLTGAVVQARVVGGDIGALSALAGRFRVSERSLVLEYIRPGFIQLPPGLHTVDAARILSVQRNSTATYVDDAGVLQTAAANVLRYEGGQVLVEGDGTNHLLHSQALDNAAWTGCSVSAAAELYRGMAPFWTVAKTVTTTSESRGQNAKAVAAGEVGTLTMALLSGSVSQCSVGIHNADWGLDAASTAAIVEGSGVISARGGALCTVTGLSATVPTLLRITRTHAASGYATARIYPGVHTSSTVGHSVKATRVQYEQSASAGSYIPTTTAAATRAADIITVAA